MQRPTCTDLRIRSTDDAHKVFYAVKTGMLEMVTRRLDMEERNELRSGCVYVWEERGSKSEVTGLGIERFTEGRRWSPSRVRDGFLFYYERWSPPNDTQYQSTSQQQQAPANWEPLVKQTYSVFVETVTGQRKWHLTAYFTQATVDQLQTVDDLSGVGDADVPPTVFQSTRTVKTRRQEEPTNNDRPSHEAPPTTARVYAPYPPTQLASSYSSASPPADNRFSYHASADANANAASRENLLYPNARGERSPSPSRDLNRQQQRAFFPGPLSSSPQNDAPSGGRSRSALTLAVTRNNSGNLHQVPYSPVSEIQSSSYQPPAGPTSHNSTIRPHQSGFSDASLSAHRRHSDRPILTNALDHVANAATLSPTTRSVSNYGILYPQNPQPSSMTASTSSRHYNRHHQQQQQQQQQQHPHTLPPSGAYAPPEPRHFRDRSESLPPPLRSHAQPVPGLPQPVHPPVYPPNPPPPAPADYHPTAFSSNSSSYTSLYGLPGYTPAPHGTPYSPPSSPFYESDSPSISSGSRSSTSSEIEHPSSRFRPRQTNGGVGGPSPGAGTGGGQVGGHQLAPLKSLLSLRTHPYRRDPADDKALRMFEP